MKQFTFKPWLMALFIAAICLCAVLPGLQVRAGVFSPYGSQSFSGTQEEVSFTDQPDDVIYLRYYDESPSEFSSYFNINGYTEGMGIRIQLEDATDPSPISVRAWNYTVGEYSDPLQFDDKGSFDLLTNGNCATISLSFSCAASATIRYKVQIFSDTSCTNLLAQSPTKTVQFNHGEEYPQFEYSSQRITGDKDERIAFEIPVTQAGFMEGKPAQLRFELSFFVNDDSGFAIYGADGTPLTQNDNGQYVYPITSLASGSYAFSISSSTDCKGSIWAWMYDGNGCGLSISTGQYQIVIPESYSPDDLSVLKAIADANSGNDQLKELYYNGGYKTSSNVTWDYNQTPHRLTYLAIEDYQRLAITNLDLSGLDALTSLYINGAKNLTSLDVSALT